LLSARVQIARTGMSGSGPVSPLRAARPLTIERVIRATALQHLVVNTVIIASKNRIPNP
jgi:hypothetical protein